MNDFAKNALYQDFYQMGQIQWQNWRLGWFLSKLSSKIGNFNNWQIWQNKKRFWLEFELGFVLEKLPLCKTFIHNCTQLNLHNLTIFVRLISHLAKSHRYYDKIFEQIAFCPSCLVYVFAVVGTPFYRR
ncbi:hypothetical protein [Moraxella marmotae]|uniref:hypothetical protein n=1 Tax=Moraxella marmotae TaxID=3344520 RepID=UPI0035D417CD